MFEPSRFAFLVVVVFLLSNYGVQCYYPQPAPYAPYSPYSQPYPYMGQYAPVQAPSWNHFYPPYPYGPSAAVPAFAPPSVPVFAPAAEPASKPTDISPVATPAPESPPSPSLPIIDFKKGSIIDYEYFYDTLPEDFGKTRMIIMLNKTSSATVTTTQTPTVPSKPVFKKPSFEEQTDEATEIVVDEVMEATTEEVTQETTEMDLDVRSSNEDETEYSTTDEVTTEELIEDTTVMDDSVEEDPDYEF